MYCLLLCEILPQIHSWVSNVNFVLWREVQTYFLYAKTSIQYVECAITEIYLILVARNILKVHFALIFYLFFFFQTYRLIGRQLVPSRYLSSCSFSLGSLCVLSFDSDYSFCIFKIFLDVQSATVQFKTCRCFEQRHTPSVKI